MSPISKDAPLSPEEEEMKRRAIDKIQKLKYKAQQKNLEHITPTGLELLQATVIPLSFAIDQFVQDALSHKRGRKSTVARYLFSIDPTVAAYLTCRVLFDSISKVVPLARTAIKIGERIEDECQLRSFKQTHPKAYEALHRAALNFYTTSYERRTHLIEGMLKEKVNWQPWQASEHCKVGTKLIDLFAQMTCLITFETIPIGSHKTQTVIRATPSLLKYIHTHNDEMGLLQPLYGPLSIPPKPWTSFEEGGFHTLKVTLVKTKNPAHRALLKKASMPTVFTVLNALQKVPYRIHEKVFTVMEALYQQTLTKSSPFFTLPKTALDQEMLAQKWALKNILEEARRFLQKPAFFFVFTADFRGRVYPVTTYLSPQGNDLCRGLLTFAESEAKPLGEGGARWLAIQGANCWGNGIDKHFLQARIEWTHQQSDQILAIAKNPLAHQEEWQKADKPVQFLAFCFEWARYQEEGISYASSLPLHVDGRNNALQHYSALLRDEDLGRATNLLPTEKPQDLYQDIADTLNDLLAQEAHAGVKLAQQWKGLLTRKVVKRPVMTYCYDAHPQGFEQQLMEEVIYPLRFSATTWPFDDNGWEAAKYLVKLLCQVLEARIQPAKTCMTWFKDLARQRAKHHLPMYWVNPAGFIVLQAYPKLSSYRIETELNGVEASLTLNRELKELDSRAQASRISANFIHSLDSAAMMLCIKKALEHNLTAFNMIHDSFGTVAADMEVLNTCLRRAFIDMYQPDLLQKLLEENPLPPSSGNVFSFPAPPTRGTLDLEEIMSSSLFFS